MFYLLLVIIIILLGYTGHLMEAITGLAALLGGVLLVVFMALLLGINF